jgi:predicted small lipoprotein YifL
MTLIKTTLRLATLVVAAATLVACGRVGTLEQPAPLYGAKVKAQYQARKAAEAAAAQARRDNGVPDKVSEPDQIMAPPLPAGAAPPPSGPAPSPQPR